MQIITAKFEWGHPLYSEAMVWLIVKGLYPTLVQNNFVTFLMFCAICSLVPVENHNHLIKLLWENR